MKSFLQPVLLHPIPGVLTSVLKSLSVLIAAGLTVVGCTTHKRDLTPGPHPGVVSRASHELQGESADRQRSTLDAELKGETRAYLQASHKTGSDTLDASSAASFQSALTPLSRQVAGLPDETHRPQSGAAAQAIAATDTRSSQISASVNTSDPQPQLLSINAVRAPLDALLFALATEAGVQMKLVGDLPDKVTLSSRDNSLEYILKQLSEQSDFAWQLEDGQLTVWNGDPYGHSYSIDYLNMQRRTQSSVGLATQVGTINAVNSASGSIANSSQTRVENNSEFHFWQSLKTDIDGLISQYRLTGHADSSASATAQYSINAEAGLVTLHATPEIHQALRRYLILLHDSTSRQVLIEATVVEVALSDSFEAGVDWQVLADGVNGISAAQTLVGAPLVNASTINRLVAPSGLLSLVQQGSGGDVRATLSLLEQFGDVRILSRPRIIALNNQSSVLKVVDNRVYFTVNVERRQTETRDEVVTETEIHTVPVGLVMNVTPQISRDGAVMLNVRPTLSRILGFVNDPNPELAQANVRNGVPEIQVRELESMLRVQSGNVAIIGGLMQETTEDNNMRLPGLGRLPLLGHLFSQSARKRQQTELLIVLKPTVMPAANLVAGR